MTKFQTTPEQIAFKTGVPEERVKDILTRNTLFSIDRMTLIERRLWELIGMDSKEPSLVDERIVLEWIYTKIQAV